MIQFLEENGYDVSYIDRRQRRPGHGRRDHRAAQGLHVRRPRRVLVRSRGGQRHRGPEHGGQPGFFTGNEVYWKTRWALGRRRRTPYRTLITYKESLDSAQTDPSDPPTWTGEWADPRFSPPADGGQPQNALTGQLWTVNAGTYAIQCPSQYAKLRFWRNTAVASLQPGQTATLAPETLGYEWDEDVDNGFRPAGLIDMSSTTDDPAAGDGRLPGRPGVSDTATHHLTLYRAASGALVFGAGTVQWAWGLELQPRRRRPDPVDPDMQQATINMLADMGVQPATLMSGLVAGHGVHRHHAARRRPSPRPPRLRTSAMARP